jgi:hypothetical protein
MDRGLVPGAIGDEVLGYRVGALLSDSSLPEVRRRRPLDYVY